MKIHSHSDTPSSCHIPAISLVTQLHKFPFFSTITDFVTLSNIEHFPSTLYRGFRFRLLEDSVILLEYSQISWSGFSLLMSTSYLTTLKIFYSLLLLILIILARLCVCFMLLLIHSLLLFYLLVPILSVF